MKPILAYILMAYSVLSYVHAEETYILSGKVKDLSDTSVELQGFHQGAKTIDTTDIDKLGNFHFRFTDNTPVGLYRLNPTSTNLSLKYEKTSQLYVHNCHNSFNYVTTLIESPFVVPEYYLLVDIGMFFDKIFLMFIQKIN